MLDILEQNVWDFEKNTFSSREFHVIKAKYFLTVSALYHKHLACVPFFEPQILELFLAHVSSQLAVTHKLIQEKHCIK